MNVNSLHIPFNGSPSVQIYGSLSVSSPSFLFSPLSVIALLSPIHQPCSHTLFMLLGLTLSSPSSHFTPETIINYFYPSMLSFSQSPSIFQPIQQSGCSWLAAGHPTPSLSVTLLSYREQRLTAP